VVKKQSNIIILLTALMSVSANASFGDEDFRNEEESVSPLNSANPLLSLPVGIFNNILSFLPSQAQLNFTSVSRAIDGNLLLPQEGVMHFDEGSLPV